MKVLEIAFTGYSVTDMKRSRAFYEGLLGLEKSRNFGDDEANEKWVEYDFGGGCLALIAGGADWPPSNVGTAAAFEVDDFEGYVKKLREAGIKFIWEPYESPVCWMAVVPDPDGNRVVIHHRKSERPDAA